uniref:WIYLD domain-containing protein n=1 Tax=Leersia perrieri TaxID=77586 RepID=A0A0D9XBB5_9ORYZ
MPRQRPKRGERRIDAAIDHFTPMGYSSADIRAVVKQLLGASVYGDDGWPFLEEDSYRVVQEALFEKQEHDEQLQLQLLQQQDDDEQAEEEPQPQLQPLQQIELEEEEGPQMEEQSQLQLLQKEDDVREEEEPQLQQYYHLLHLDDPVMGGLVSLILRRSQTMKNIQKACFVRGGARIA